MMDKFATQIFGKLDKDRTLNKGEYINAARAAGESLKPAIRAEQGALVETFLKAHADDLAKYEFKCERYGDFLSIFVKRGDARIDAWSGNEILPHVVAAINIGKSPRIKFASGHGVDLLGQLYPELSWEREGETDKYRAFISVRNNALPYLREVIYEPPVQSSNQNQVNYYANSGGPERFGVVVDACARCAEDDTISFSKGGVVLHVPFGRGQAIYEQILKSFS